MRGHETKSATTNKPQTTEQGFGVFIQTPNQSMNMKVRRGGQNKKHWKSLAMPFREVESTVLESREGYLGRPKNKT
jgi:hypothetical protein